MARTIYKYDLTIGTLGEAHLLSAGAKILAFGNQRETCVIWAEIDPDAPKVRRQFVVYGTGHPMPDNPGIYIGTALFAGGALVLHAYEVEAS